MFELIHLHPSTSLDDEDEDEEELVSRLFVIFIDRRRLAPITNGDFRFPCHILTSSQMVL